MIFRGLTVRQSHIAVRAGVDPGGQVIVSTFRKVSAAAVAREAGISRSWLYSQPDIRAHIDHLRTQRPSPPPAPPPQRQRASDSSLMRRLEATTERLRHLEAENRELRHALAEALGQARQRHVTGARPDTPGKPAPRIIGPC